MISKNISLKKYNTFGLDFNANCLITVKSEKEAITVINKQEILKEPLLVLGGGSNLLFTRNFEGTIIKPDVPGIKVEELKNDFVILSSGAGVNWDNLVDWTVNHNFWGLENLSLIPGTVGASPVQNIGAYGVEVKDYIEKIRAVSLKDGSIREFCIDECRFGYRDSIFKNELKGRFLITKVFFRLSTKEKLNTEYSALKEAIEMTGSLSLLRVREAVINIRRSKLPDPEKTGNAGSFFKNPVVSNSVADSLRKKYPKVPCYSDTTNGIKIAAGWLIDQCGWKGKRFGDAGVHDKQALVLVNYGRASGIEIFMLSEEIKKSVSDKFGIELEREVEVL
jgi:UDP-N-acetylmuramate dehydrogenase